jgi:mannose-6-phosphate isomerase-like protein (cupin superfamily)
MKTESLLRPPNSKFLKSGKVILKKGEEIGEHLTEKREELIIVLKGIATLIKGDKKFELKEKQVHYIKEGIKHNVLNNSDEELEYIYVVSLFT